MIYQRPVTKYELALSSLGEKCEVERPLQTKAYD